MSLLVVSWLVCWRHEVGGKAGKQAACFVVLCDKVRLLLLAPLPPNELQFWKEVEFVHLNMAITCLFVSELVS